MVDALLFSFRDAIRTLRGYNDAAHCEIVGDPEGRPGNMAHADWFAAVHQGATRGDMMNALNQYFGVNVTLTMRVANVPIDRVGDQLLAKKLAAQPGPGMSPSFNSRVQTIGTLLHMAWDVMGDANNNLMTMLPEAETVYGFSEPAAWASVDPPSWVGPEWFSSDPEQGDDVGIKATLSFENCRRGPQAIASYS